MTLFTIILSALLFQNTDTLETKKDTIHQKEISEVTVYSMVPNNIIVPQIVVNKKDLEKRIYRTPADALQTQTGISLSRDGSWGTSVNIRGMGEQRLMFLVNGDRIQSATDVAGALSTVSLHNIEKIEVIKGAGSVLFGSGAMGGVVNFVNSLPDYANLLTVNSTIQTSYSTVNNLTASSVKIDFCNDKWYLRASGSLRNARNTVTPNGTLPNSKFNDGSWSLNGGMRRNNNQELLVGYSEFYGWDIGIPGNNSFQQTATVKYPNINRRQLFGEYIFTDISDLITKLSIKGYTQNITRNVESKYTPNTSTVKLILPSSFNSTSGAKVSADLYFNDYNTMTVGAESWLRKSETRRINITSGVVDTTVIADQPTPLAKVVNAGIFALYKKIIDPKYSLMNFGLRLDYFQTSNDTLFKELFQYKIINDTRIDVVNAKVIRMLPSKKPDFSYSAHIDLQLTPSKQNKFAIMLATAYRIATIEERFKYIDLGSGTPKIGNPDLKPEKGGFLNLSYIYSGKNLNIKTDVFANYFFDLIAEKAGTYTSVSGSSFNALITTNINRALYAGAEAEINWLINKNLTFYSNASYVRAQDMSNGSFLTQIPPLHGIIQLNYYTNKLIKTTLTANWAATQNEAATTEVKTPGYLIFNFDIQTKQFNVSKTKLKIMAGVENILDKAYKNHLFATRGLDYYEPGRNIFAKISCSF